MFLMILTEEIDGKFYEKDLQKANQEEFRSEKVIKRKRNKLYLKWKGFDNSFNSWIKTICTFWRRHQYQS